MKDLVHELEIFDDITKMLCTNTDYSFNNYLPMKELIERKLESKEVDDNKIFDSETIKSFREIMRKHWSEFNLSDDTMRLARMASMLCPINMIDVDRADLLPFADRVLEMLGPSALGACAVEG